MTVQELIDALQMIGDKSLTVRVPIMTDHEYALEYWADMDGDITVEKQYENTVQLPSGWPQRSYSRTTVHLW